MFFINLPKILLHRVPFLRKKAADPLYSQALGILAIFMTVGAFWLMLATLRFSGLFYNPNYDTYFQNPYPPIRGEAFVQFDFGVKPSRAFRGSVIDGMTLLDTLQQAAIVGSFDINWQEPVTIDGIFDGMYGKHWVFYKNKDVVNQNPEAIPVKPRDEIFAKFE